MPLYSSRIRSKGYSLYRSIEDLIGYPLEIHCHRTTGLAPLRYLEAMKVGVKTFHCAVGPLGNCPSQPAMEYFLRNACLLGYTSRVNEELLLLISTTTLS